ncbi:MAG: sensor histidine kinase [Nocardioides sp.]
MNVTLSIIATTVAWAAGAGLVCWYVAWLARRASLQWLTVGVALTAVLVVLAGVVGTARAMFLSSHDFHVILIVCLVGGVVATVVASVMGRRWVTWSRGLRADVRRLGAHQEPRSTGRGPSEFQDLAAELEQASRSLALMREREARLEKARRELISWVSHDLRTPLTGIRAMTEALEDGMAEDPDEYHRLIRADVDRMTRMVEDLFELSRIHAGVLRLNPEPVVLGDLVSEAIAGADPLARLRGVRIGGHVEPGIRVVADPAGLSRVVANLLMNAIRHTPEDGTVEIEGRAVPGGVELSVVDGCGGLRTEEMARVFDVAWQGEPARTPPGADSAARLDPSLASGAGIGLAIVKGIVEAHQGTVQVENRDPGCRFLVSLPA